MRLRFLDMDELRWDEVITYKEDRRGQNLPMSRLGLIDAGTSADRVVEQQRVDHCRRKNTTTQAMPELAPSKGLFNLCCNFGRI